MPVPKPVSVTFRSRCPIASTLDLVGDRWTILIIRDLFFGASRYSDFARSPEGIPTNILASRLRMMESQALVAKIAYQTKPKRFAYQLTDKGKALLPVMRALKNWGMDWIHNRSAEPPTGPRGR
jgi:DNA-binding HxlR family transcriptional regulator